MDYYITNNAIEILTGTSNKVSSVYIEAAKNIDDDKKTMTYLKSFLKSIGKVSSKNKETIISDSKGNINDFSKYEDIVKSLDILKKGLSNNKTVDSLMTIKSCLEKYKSHYMDSYKRDIDIISLEYECAVYLLTAGTTFMVVSNFTVDDKMKVSKSTKSGDSNIIEKMINDMASELKSSNHEKYLKELIAVGKPEINESVIFEGAVTSLVAATLSNIAEILGKGSNIFNVVRYAAYTIKNTVFGIIPLIRSVVYLQYKKKANTITHLETLSEFIELNIEQLNNRTNIDEDKKAEIIKKQKAKAEAYRKKAEKLRAAFIEQEKDTADALEEDNVNIQEETIDEFDLD